MWVFVAVTPTKLECSWSYVLLPCTLRKHPLTPTSTFHLTPQINIASRRCRYCFNSQMPPGKMATARLTANFLAVQRCRPGVNTIGRAFVMLCHAAVASHVAFVYSDLKTQRFKPPMAVFPYCHKAHTNATEHNCARKLQHFTDRAELRSERIFVEEDFVSERIRGNCDKGVCGQAQVGGGTRVT